MIINFPSVCVFFFNFIMYMIKLHTFKESPKLTQYFLFLDWILFLTFYHYIFNKSMENSYNIKIIECKLDIFIIPVIYLNLYSYFWDNFGFFWKFQPKECLNLRNLTFCFREELKFWCSFLEAPKPLLCTTQELNHIIVCILNFV